MNKVILVGRLTRDPEVSFTANGIAHARFTLAVDRRRSKNSQDQNQQTADFIPVTAWREQAQTIGNYFHKGMRVLVEGKIQISNYTAKDGTKKTFTDILLDNFEFLESKRDSNSYSNTNSGQAYIEAPKDDIPPDDDGGIPPEPIPF